MEGMSHAEEARVLSVSGASPRRGRRWLGEGGSGILRKAAWRRSHRPGDLPRMERGLRQDQIYLGNTVVLWTGAAWPDRSRARIVDSFRPGHV